MYWIYSCCTQNPPKTTSRSLLSAESPMILEGNEARRGRGNKLASGKLQETKSNAKAKSLCIVIS